MKLSELLAGVAEYGGEDREISLITDKNSEICKDCIFICVKGKSFDGHSCAAEAESKGAALIVCERDMGVKRQLITDNSRKLYGELVAAWFSHPERRIRLIGVTGTNGKTTISMLIKSALTAMGHKCGLIGTIQNEIGDTAIETGNTTPFVKDYMSLLGRMADEGCEYCIMEVSSFALDQYRIGPSHFDAAVFTNLTQDHLDYHENMENYYLAKRRLFEVCDIAVVNTDDEYGRRLFSEISCKKYSFGIKTHADFYADVIRIRPEGASYWLCTGDKSYRMSMKLTGGFNVYNSAEAVIALISLGFDPQRVIPAVCDCGAVKGRCEVIPTGRDFTVICDYAHTDDAIENVLSGVREYTDGRLICLFGCGGNRDRGKRPKMAAAAARNADYLIVTSDNPRNEDPQAIIDDILTGLVGTDIPYDVVVDRRSAILHAMRIAKKGDVIVLAGKGHEDYQILAGNRKIHFDEREVVAECLKEL